MTLSRIIEPELGAAAATAPDPIEPWRRSLRKAHKVPERALWDCLERLHNVRGDSRENLRRLAQAYLEVSRCGG